MRCREMAIKRYSKTLKIPQKTCSSTLIRFDVDEINAIGNFGCHLNFTQLLDEQVAFFYGYHSDVIAWQFQ